VAPFFEPLLRKALRRKGEVLSRMGPGQPMMVIRNGVRSPWLRDVNGGEGKG